MIVAFLTIFSSLVHELFRKLHTTIACNNIDPPQKKFGGTKFWPKRVKIGPEASFFCHFLKFGVLAFLEIAYNDKAEIWAAK